MVALDVIDDTVTFIRSALHDKQQFRVLNNFIVLPETAMLTNPGKGYRGVHGCDVGDDIYACNELFINETCLRDEWVLAMAVKADLLRGFCQQSSRAPNSRKKSLITNMSLQRDLRWYKRQFRQGCSSLLWCNRLIRNG